MDGYYYAYNFKGWGNIVIAESGGSIAAVSLSPKSVAECCEKETELIRKAKRQLEEYFAGERKAFDLPLGAAGTEFQQKVWAALLEIPYGKTVSYGEIAEHIGSPRAARAVGGACNRNPVCIIVPCHRVVGANGSLTGYAFGVETKHRLIELEKQPG